MKPIKRRNLEKQKKELAEKMKIAEKAIDDAKAAWARERSVEEKQRKIAEYTAFLEADNEADPADTLRLLCLKLRRLRERLSINNLTMSTKRNTKEIARVEKLLVRALDGRRPAIELEGVPIDSFLKIEAYLEEIKDDTDSDFDSIIYLLSFRTQRVARLYSADQERGSLIAAASEAFRRCAEDDYEHRAMKKVEEKYGELKMDEGDPDELGMIEMDLHYANETPANAKQVRQDVHEAFQAAEAAKMKDFRTACDIMLAEMFSGWSRIGSIRKAFGLLEKNVWGWWD